MGVYASVTVDESVTLPYLPDEIEQEGITWQSKKGLPRYGGPYRVKDGVLLEASGDNYRQDIDDDTGWESVNYHGEFEIHRIIRRGEVMNDAEEYVLDLYMQYELKFTEGELDDVVFIGERFSNEDDCFEAALEQLEAWQDWKECHE